MLAQPNMVSPLVRPPHANSFPGGVQRTPMGPPMSPNLGGGLMPHPRPQHPPRGPCGPPLAPRGTQAALKAEQDLKVIQTCSWEINNTEYSLLLIRTILVDQRMLLFCVLG